MGDVPTFPPESRFGKQAGSDRIHAALTKKLTFRARARQAHPSGTGRAGGWFRGRLGEGVGHFGLQPEHLPVG